MTSPSKDRLRRAAPIALSIVFVLIAGLVIWLSTDAAPPPSTTPQASAPPPQTQTQAPSTCGARPGDQVAIADGALRLGTIFPQGGSDADSAGAPLVAATQLAVDDVNRAGGIPGLPSPQLGLDANVDEGAPGSPTACDSASRLLASGDDVVVGPYASADTLTIDQRVTQAGRLMVSPSNTLADLSTRPDQGLYFRTASSDELQADVLADLVAQEGRRNVAIVAEEDPFARSLAGALPERLRASGVTSTTKTYADPSAFAGIADEVARGPYDGVVFVGFRDIAGLAGMILGNGPNPPGRGFYGSTGLLQNTSADEASPGAPGRLQGLRGFVPWAEPAFNGRLQAFHRERFGAELEDVTYGAQTYDAVIAVSLAAAAVRADDPRRIAEELPRVTRGGQRCDTYQACVAILRQDPTADIDYDGVSGPLGFTPRGDVCTGLYNLAAFGPSGRLDQGIRGGLFSPDLCR